jgi:hypothetical protein
LATNTLTSAASTALTLQSAGTTAITVDTSQNVGIGTPSPSYRLDAQGTVSSANVARIKPLAGSGGTTVILDIQAGNSSSLIKFTNNGGITFPASQVVNGDANTLDDYETGTWTPSVSSGSGSLGSVGAVSGVYTKIGNVLNVEFTVTITLNGTGSNSIQVGSLPFAATANAYIGCGRENAATGNLLQLYLPSSQSTVTIKNYNDTYPAGNGYTFFGTITYRTS